MAGASLQAGESLLLELPLDSAYLTTARLFAAAAGRQLGLQEEIVEDLKLAISEACTGAINATPGVEGAVQLSITAAEGRVAFRLVTEGPIDVGPMEPNSDHPSAGVTDGMGLEVTQALFDDTRVEATATGGSAISFSVPIAR